MHEVLVGARICLVGGSTLNLKWFVVKVRVVFSHRLHLPSGICAQTC